MNDVNANEPFRGLVEDARAKGVTIGPIGDSCLHSVASTLPVAGTTRRVWLRELLQGEACVLPVARLFGALMVYPPFTGFSHLFVSISSAFA
jgi:hypothetical protein